MPLREAEQPLNRMVPLPLSTMLGRTYSRTIKVFNFKINACPGFNYEKKMMKKGRIDNFFNYFAWLPIKN